MKRDGPDPTEATARGRSARAAARRGAHGRWAPAHDRPDPVRVLASQDASRVPELVPIRYGRMLASPYAFFRGAAAIMAADLATTPVTGLRAQLCGDAHLENFGAFAAPDRRLIFDIDDFDETLPGPWEWDVKRLVASIAVAGRWRGFAPEQRENAILAALREYRGAMRRFADTPTLDVWYARLDVAEQLARWAPRVTAKDRKTLDRGLARARRKDNVRAAARLTREVDGVPRFIHDPPLLVPVHELLPDHDARALAAHLRQVLAAYRKSLPHDRRHLLDGYRPIDFARKVVGIGSVGAAAWIALLVGRDAGDPLVLQVKAAGPSALAPFAGRSRYANCGRRVVEGQRLMQAASDVFLGWLRVENGLDNGSHDYYVRQLWNAKASASVATMRPRELAAYSEICGWTLARAHARSGDCNAIAAYLGRGDGFDRALHRFAEAYADQNERDHDALAAAVAAGDVEASRMT